MKLLDIADDSLIVAGALKESIMFDLTGKTALVTGATGGIGGAIARALVGQGARVAISGTREDALHALASELGTGVAVLPANLSDEGAVEALMPAVEAALGQLDILVNNAGLTRDNLFMRMKDDEWDAVMRVNLDAAFRLMRAGLRPMMRKRFGRIISITSVVGTTGNAGQANYAASKAALAAMSKSLAAEVASRNITVNCVAPGFIATAMTDALTPKQTESILANVPMGRMGQAEDVAGAVVYLASAQAAYVTGQTLHVNGGMLMI
jgi:3-oxoacyl-[acyl-carrier protein] reductase